MTTCSSKRTFIKSLIKFKFCHINETKVELILRKTTLQCFYSINFRFEEIIRYCNSYSIPKSCLYKLTKFLQNEKFIANIIGNHSINQRNMSLNKVVYLKILIFKVKKKDSSTKYKITDSIKWHKSNET